MYGERGYSSPILDLALNGLEWSVSRSDRITPVTYWIGGWKGLQSRSGRCGEDKNFLLLPGIETRSSNP
jgi:hypothetical protein